MMAGTELSVSPRWTSTRPTVGSANRPRRKLIQSQVTAVASGSWRDASNFSRYNQTPTCGWSFLAGHPSSLGRTREGYAPTGKSTHLKRHQVR